VDVAGGIKERELWSWTKGEVDKTKVDTPVELLLALWMLLAA